MHKRVKHHAIILIILKCVFITDIYTIPVLINVLRQYVTFYINNYEYYLHYFIGQNVLLYIYVAFSLHFLDNK